MGTVLNIHVEPEDKDVVTSAINAATQYIWLEMYLLEDPAVITALSNAAQRNAGQGLIDVRVILEPSPDFATAPTDPSSPTQALKNTQVQVRYRPPQAVIPFPPGSTFQPVSHAKMMLIDDVAYVMSSNFTPSGLGDTRWIGDRDYMIVDPELTDVQTLKTMFLADWNGNSWNNTAQSQVSSSGFGLLGTHLLISPVNSHQVIYNLIASAQHSIYIELEYSGDPAIESALAGKAANNVDVRLIVPRGQLNLLSTSISSSKIQSKECSDLSLDMHAKMMLVDEQIAYVGSQNFTAASLKHNREVGIVFSAQESPDFIKLVQTFQLDWSGPTQGQL